MEYREAVRQDDTNDKDDDGSIIITILLTTHHSTYYCVHGCKITTDVTAIIKFENQKYTRQV